MSVRSQQLFELTQARARARKAARRGRIESRLVDGSIGAVMLVALTLIFLDVPNYLFAVGGVLLPKYIYFGIAAVLAPLLLFRLKSIGQYVGSPIMLWVGAFLAVTAAHWAFAFFIDDWRRAANILTNMQFALFAVIIGAAAATRREGAYASLFAALAAVLGGLVVLDFAMPGLVYPLSTEQSVIGRGAGTYINPNLAAEGLLLTYLLALPALSVRMRVILLLFVGFATVVTFSRGATFGWFAIWLFLAAYRAIPRSTIVLPILGILFLPSLIGLIETYLLGRADIGRGLDDILARLDFFQTFSAVDFSAQERALVRDMGIDLFLQNPLVGAGAAATNFWSHRAQTHNELVLLAAEYGVVGVLFWIWLVVLILRGTYFRERGLAIAAAFAFAYLSMFSHTMLEMAFWLVGLTFLCQRTPRAKGAA